MFMSQMRTDSLEHDNEMGDEALVDILIISDLWLPLRVPIKVFDSIKCNNEYGFVIRESTQKHRCTHTYVIAMNSPVFQGDQNFRWTIF